MKLSELARKNLLLTNSKIGSAAGLCIFDGDCGICHQSVRLGRRLGARCSFIPYQQMTDLPFGVSVDQCRQEVVFVDQLGRVFGGAAAVAQVLRGSSVPIIGRIIDAPPMLPLSEKIYRWVARNRSRIPVRGYCST